MLRNYKDLKVWQKAYNLCLKAYKITTKFPSEERYGLTSQIRRASISIPSNIAEGYSRKHLQEYIHFLWIAYGSGAELETQLMLSKDIGYLNEEDFNDLILDYREVERMLSALAKSLEAKKLKSSKS
ncbi:four helix bundle protein [candidate division WOR-3 bacterium]|nr:four helix bundle protein [candidate division WOR-3 bacterium]